MKKNALIVLLMLTLAQVTPAFADELEKTLKSQYEKHVLGLRNPLQQTHQEFDSNGKLLTPGSPASWTAYGGIYIRKLSLGPDKLQMEGPWVGLGTKNKDGKPELIQLGKDLKVEIHLDHPAGSADEARAILDRVFFLDDKDFEHAIPEFRRSDFDANETLYKVGKKFDVIAPVPTHTPEPEFSEQARTHGFQGTVVLGVVIDKAGTVSRITIERALGMDLDQQAVEATKMWRFQPARRNSEPVAVEMTIEVSFNLDVTPRRR
jgi:TonB family protein